MSIEKKYSYYYKGNKINKKEAAQIAASFGNLDIESFFFYYNTLDELIFCDYDSLEKLGFGLSYHNAKIVPLSKLNKEEIVNAKYIAFNFKEHIKNVSADELGIKSQTFIGTGGFKNTFGVEIEVCRGVNDYRELLHKKINAHCEFDGSLRDPDGSEYGSEYITGVLKGDNGLLNLSKLCNILANRCHVDKRCGLHVHVGGFKATPEFIVTAYKLINDIQDELLTIVSPSRRNNDTCGKLIDEREYIKNTINEYGYHYGITEIYKTLFKKFANGRELDRKINKKYFHPGGKYTDRYGGLGISDVKKLYRYKVVNFIPACFNMRKSENFENLPFTLEFRCHQGTTNFKKIKNWILLCLTIVNYVENYQRRILFSEEPITIDEIIKTMLNINQYSTLNKYINDRKDKFSGKEAMKIEIQEYQEKVEMYNNKLKSVIF
jgi:hypothetical protein